MNEAILLARLDALERDLRLLRELKRDWSGRFKNVRLAESLWLDLDETIGGAARAIAKNIPDIRSMNDPQAAWAAYAELCEKTQPLFRESFELIGGLAFRDMDLDVRICSVADELIQKCALYTGVSPALTVPGYQETMSRTMGRIIRVRFPEWTIWTLPLTAYEYGKVVLEKEEDRFTKYRDEVARLPVLVGMAVENQSMASVSDLVAEAFATYVMGPAYVCSSIYLRLNPALAYKGSGRSPSPDLRQRVSMAVLMRMNRETDAQEGMRPYGDIIARLQETWRAMVASASPARPEAPQVQDADIESFVDIVWNTTFKAFYRAARYSHAEDGWKAALRWSGGWQQQLKENLRRNLEAESDSDEDRLIDVLNAAWHCRLYYPDRIDEIGDGALSLCNDMVNRGLTDDRAPQPLAAPSTLRGSPKRNRVSDRDARGS